MTSARCKRQAGSLPAESDGQPDFQSVHRRASRVDKFNRRDHTADPVSFFACHSKRSEESLIFDVKQHVLPTVTQRSFAFAQDDKHKGGLYQTAFAKVAEIAAGGTLHKIDGELEQANFPRVVYALYDRAQRFVFIFNLPPGAIDHCVD